MGAILSIIYTLLFSYDNEHLIPVLHSGGKSAYVTIRDADSSCSDDGYWSQDDEKSGTRRISLKTLIEDRVPSLSTSFSPCWWLPNGHVQTLYGALSNFDNVNVVQYKRTLLRVPDGGTLGLDFTPPTLTKDQGTEAPVIVVLHGLSGGSYEPYIKSVLAAACLPKSQGGLGARAVVVNSRGCAGVPLTSPQLYSPGHTDDLRSALLYISAIYPLAPLLGLGFSLGANILTRYMGEEGSNARLRAACVLACPWDIVKTREGMDGRFLNRQIYSRFLAKGTIRYVKSHAEVIKRFPHSHLSRHLPVILSLKNPLLKDTSEHVSRIAGGNSGPGGLFPFRTSHEHDSWASSHTKLPGIAMPFLAINSKDDPIATSIPYEEASKNPWVTLATTEHGGHLAWFEGSLLGRNGVPPQRWFKKPVLEWFSAVLDIVDDSTRCSSPLRELKGGFIGEDGRRFVGYRVLKTDLEVDGTRTVPKI